MRIFGLGPVQEAAACNLLNARQFLLSALETFLLHDGFGDLSWEMAGLEIGKCGAEDTIRRVKPAQRARTNAKPSRALAPGRARGGKRPTALRGEPTRIVTDLSTSVYVKSNAL